MKAGRNPTSEQWGSYERAYAYFNRVLFGGKLPVPILNFSRKSKRTLGFFAPERWENGRAKVHEISLNPDTLAHRSKEQIASTLVHEMAHLWDQEHGKPGRGGYHGKTWADQMERIGLMPSTTGGPDGKRTGQRVTHYVIKGGPFAAAFKKLPGDCLLPWSSADPGSVKKPNRNKTKFTCPGCGANAWGKPDLAVTCVECEDQFESEET